MAADKPHHIKADYQFAQNKEAPLCKGSCREATEGLFFIEFMCFTIPPPRSSAPPFALNCSKLCGQYKKPPVGSIFKN